MAAATVFSDPARLAAVDALLGLAGPNRGAMDRLAGLAATVMDAPVGIVSLIGARRQHLVGLHGMAGPLLDRRWIPLRSGYCQATLRLGRPLYLQDAAGDPEFVAHPARQELGFVAYAGAPLAYDGQLVGTVCVVDERARRWRGVDQRALEAVASAVVSELGLHLDLDRRQRLLDAFDLAPAVIAVTRGPEHRLDYANAAYRAVFGRTPLGRPGRAVLPGLNDELFELMDRVLDTGETHTGTGSPISMIWPGEDEPRTRYFDFSYSAVRHGGGRHRRDREGLLIVAVEVTERVLASSELARQARHQRLLANTTAALNRDLDPIAELQALAEAVVPELADLSTVHLLARPVPPGRIPPLPVITDRAAIAAVPELRPPPPVAAGLRWTDGDDPIVSTIRQGALSTSPIATPGVPLWALSTHSADTFRGGLDHVVLAPVIVEGLVVAVVSFGLREGRRLWDDAELALLGQLAQQAGAALGHGLSYQRTRGSASVLQRSLLTEPPRVDGLELCARYRPAGRDEVGGDWYDAFERAPGQLALVIGDVLGHDITAAAAMAQLRATLRSVALDRPDGPADVLGRLESINTRLGITPLATLVHAYLTRCAQGWRLRWANAGHPPPLLVRPDGQVDLLDGTRGSALVPALQGHRSEAELAVSSGTTLLLYTDGLIERGRTLIDDNLAVVRKLVHDNAGEPLEALCDRLVGYAGTRDDIAILAVRVPAPDPATSPSVSRVTCSRTAVATHGDARDTGGTEPKPQLSRPARR
jgi:serine phosphatase RsbU (regulator of sigma subunit)/PAS domain-containing protein